MLKGHNYSVPGTTTWTETTQVFPCLLEGSGDGRLVNLMLYSDHPKGLNALKSWDSGL